MKVVVTFEDKTEQTFDDVADLFLSLSQFVPVTKPDHTVIGTRVRYHTFSWAGDQRELLKEVRQAVAELEDTVKQQREAAK